MSPLREFYFACALALGLSVAGVLFMLANRDGRQQPDCQTAIPSQNAETNRGCAASRDDRLRDRILKLLVG